MRSIVVTHKDIIDSDYNVRHCRGAERLAYDTLDELVGAGRGRGEVGRRSASSSTPTGRSTTRSRTATARDSAEAFAAVRGDRRRVRRAARAAVGHRHRCVVATADHGFIDVPPEESLELPASLASHAALPAVRRAARGVLPRARPSGFHAESEGLARRARRRACRAASSPTKAGSGRATPHPRFAERIGDVTLVMHGRYTVKDWTPGEPRHLHIGNHGGTQRRRDADSPDRGGDMKANVNGIEINYEIHGKEGAPWLVLQPLARLQRAHVGPADRGVQGPLPHPRLRHARPRRQRGAEGRRTRWTCWPTTCGAARRPEDRSSRTTAACRWAA